MKSLLVPLLLMAFLLSMRIAPRFWESLYNAIALQLDLSPAQLLTLSPLQFAVAFLITLPQVVTYIVAHRRKEQIPVVRHVGGGLCIAMAAFLMLTMLVTAIRMHEVVLTAIEEVAGADDGILFEAGSIEDGWYTNRQVGIAMKVPVHWRWTSLNTMYRQALAQMPAHAKPEDIAQKTPGMYPLFRFELPGSSTTTTLAALALVAFDKRSFASIGITSLEQWATTFVEPSATLEPPRPPRSQRVGSMDVFHIERTVVTGSITNHLHIFVFETENLFLGLNGTTHEAEHVRMMHEAAATIRRAQ
jgi:hypothetical protein